MMSGFPIFPAAAYICVGLLVGFGPALVKRTLRKRRQKVYSAELAIVLERGPKYGWPRIWLHRTDAGEFLLQYFDQDEELPYDRILADSETVSDAVSQLEAAGFTVHDGPG